MLEWKQYQEEAYVTLYWTSLTIPKQVISPVQVYYPVRVGGGPFNVTVLFGPSDASLSTAAGNGLFFATAGKLSTINLQSRSTTGAIIDNVNDQY